MVANRSIGLAILFTVLTCGIYGIYWFIVLTNEANYLSGETEPSGGMAFLLGLVTCGIYTIYWNYKMGKKMAAAQERAGLNPNDNSVLYLILSIFGFQIISYAIIQSDINKIAGYSA